MSINDNQHFNRSIAILRNTPATITALLTSLDDDIVNANEGENSWSPIVVIGHLISCEHTNFYTRIRLAAGETSAPVLQAFDIEDYRAIVDGKSIHSLLDEFYDIRMNNLKQLDQIDFDENIYFKKAVHPKLGLVTIKNIFSTWVAHDLSHIAQITRIMAKQYKEDVGPFIEFLRIMK